MKKKLHNILSYVQKNQKKVLINTLIVIVVGVLAAGPILYYMHLSRITYKPTKACDLLTVEKASNLLGDRVINVEKNQPVLHTDNTLATSKCGFTDSQSDTSKMNVAAVAVQSAIDDEGVAANKADFEAMSTQEDMEQIEGVGKKAFFNPDNGQLNVLQEKRWVIFTYGSAESPEAASMEDVKKFAKSIL